MIFGTVRLKFSSPLVIKVVVVRLLNNKYLNRLRLTLHTKKMLLTQCIKMGDQRVLQKNACAMKLDWKTPITVA